MAGSVVGCALAICLFYAVRTNGYEIFEPEVRQITPRFPEYDGTEGPMFDREGNFFVLTYQLDKFRGKVWRVDINNEKVHVFVAPKIGKVYSATSGGEIDREGVMWIADMRLGLMRVQPDGKFKQVVKRDLAHDRIQGMNDAAFDYHGNLWVTAPAGEIPPSTLIDGWFNKTVGSLYCYIPRENTILKVDTGFGYINGIAVQHSVKGGPKTLLVGDSFADIITAYDIEGPCKVSNKRIWGRMHGSSYDGMEFDSEGNLLIADYERAVIDVYGPNGGAPHTGIKMPFKRVTNVAFKPNSKLVYVTEESSAAAVWEFKWKYTGQKKYFEL